MHLNRVLPAQFVQFWPACRSAPGDRNQEISNQRVGEQKSGIRKKVFGPTPGDIYRHCWIRPSLVLDSGGVEHKGVHSRTQAMTVFKMSMSVQQR
jgi:hypothetical protein